MSGNDGGDGPPDSKPSRPWNPNPNETSDENDQLDSTESPPLEVDDVAQESFADPWQPVEPEEEDEFGETEVDPIAIESGQDDVVASLPETAASLPASDEDGGSGDTSAESEAVSPEAEDVQPSSSQSADAAGDSPVPLPAGRSSPPPTNGRGEPVATPGEGQEEESEAQTGEASGASWASRFGLGRFQGRSTTASPGEQPDAGQTGSDDDALGGSIGGLTDRIDGFRGFLDPQLHMPNLIPHSRYFGAASAVALLMLMANNAGLALIVASTIVPVLIVLTLVQRDVFEKESDLYVAGAAAAGVLAGIIVGWLSSVILSDQWFGTGELNFGAGGFGGRFAEAAGSAPILVLLICGLVLPAVGIAGIGAVPIVLRRWPQFRNEVMDGLIMAGASAAGLSIGLSVVMWYPMVNGSGPQTQVSDWTLTIIGSLLLRPVVFTLCGAMIGAGVWRYMFKDANNLALIPAIGGVIGVFLLIIGSIQWQSSGVWPEFLWTAAVAVAVFLVYRRVLSQAIATDTHAMGDEGERILCTSCRKFTPVGGFCAYCGAALIGVSDSPTDTEEPENPDSSD